MTQATPAPQRSAKDHFDRQAAQYDTQWNAWSEETLDWLLENAELAPTDRVLDVATGTGFTAMAFAPLAAEVVGVDVSPGMLAEGRRQARERGLANIRFEESPAERLPFEDASFDVVSCRIAAHHFLNVHQFAAEAARVLKLGGRFVLVDTSVPDDDPATASWQNAVEELRDPSHVRNYSPREWRQIVAVAGLRVEFVSDAGRGIRIPFEDWLAKAGCIAEQAAEVRRRFAEAPQSAKDAFAITTDSSGRTAFTWKRVLLKAVKTVETED